MSLRTSGYFYFATFDGDAMINESEDEARVTNSESGPITITNFELRDPELGARGQFVYEFQTQSAIPSDATMTFTLPANVVVEDTVQMVLLGERVTPTINADAKQFTVDSIPYDGRTDFSVIFSDGVRNPTIGPYQYDYVQIEFKDQYGYSIDKLTLSDVYQEVACTSNCDTCSGSLSTCTTCSYNAALEKSFYLSDSNCVEECTAGFYEDKATYECAACESPCLECSITATACTICDPNSAAPYADP